MAYERINWQNEPSEATALNDVNLNKMDSAIYELDGKATATETAITNLQDGKVDKVNGKGLSQVDNVTVTQHVAYGTVVSTIKTYKQDGTEVTSQVCNGINVDSALSDSSTNPVQNKVVKGALDNKVDKESGKGLSYYDVISVARETSKGSQIGSINLIYKDGNYESNPLYNGIEVDSSLDGTSENPVENKAIYDALNNLLPSKTVSGNPISISDASGFNAKALTVSMNPIQDLHGYSNPWAGGAGKNKLPMTVANLKSLNTSGTWSGNAYTLSNVVFTALTDDDGNVIGINANGTANASITFSCGSGVLANATYNGNGCPTGGGANTYRVQFYVTGISGSYNDTGNGAQFTNSGVNSTCAIFIANGYNAQNVKFYPMIRLSTETDATFAPYSNICPISGRTEASVTRTGKNLFDIEKWLTDNSVTFSKVGDYYKFTVANNLFDNFFEFPVGTKTLTFEINQSETTATNFRVRVKLQNGTITDKYLLDTPYTSNIKGIALNWSVRGTLCIKVQVELGNQATDFEQSNRQTATVNFGQTVYGGTFDATTGLLTITHAIKNLGELTWTKNEHQTLGPYFYANVESLGIKYEGTFLSAYHAITTEYKVTGRTPTLFLNNTFCFDGSPDYVSQIQIKDDRYSDATTFKNGLTTDSVQLCYELATPTTISTSAENISLLKGNNVISTNADDMELKYSVSLDSLLPSTTRTLSKSAPIEEKTEVVKEPEEETKEER